MSNLNLIAELGHEQVLFCQDQTAGYRSIIAIHSTLLGPAVGGTRFWHYASDEAALVDALRLSRGMTYKAAAAGLPFGGGKAVIIKSESPPDRTRLFRAHGRFVDQLAGRFITAEDVGTSPADMDCISLTTKHVAGLSHQTGDPSPFTAHGVLRAIQAAAQYRWGRDDLAGKVVALQGLGHVGYQLAKELHAAGVQLIVTDVAAERVQQAVIEFKATAVAPAAIYQAAADIFAPCALGGVLNDQTIPQLQVEIVAGAANNQLLEARHDAALQARQILYAPDYVANAGGLISGGVDLLGWDLAQSLQKIEEIYDTLLSILHLAETEGIATAQAADQVAEQRLQTARRAPEQARVNA